ncbi:MAG: ribonuclease D [Brumimicrobium sp.]
MKITTQYINQASTFEKAIESLSQKSRIYIDLEFDKNHFQYGFNLCLMQIFDGEDTCYLIDPLGDIKIEKIFPILEDKNIQLVSFAFSEDMGLLHHIGAQPTNILDLSILIRLLDYETLSLNNALATMLIEEDLKDSKEKHQKSNWTLRPLTEKQLEYAKNDVIYLPALQSVLEDKIEKLQRNEWARQEMDSFVNHNWQMASVSQYLTHKDQASLTLAEWIRFQKIMAERERLSEELNRPSYKTIDKARMLQLAKNPEIINNWQDLKGIHPKLKTISIQKLFSQLLNEAEREIEENKIKKDAPSIPYLTREEKIRLSQKRKRNNYLKNTYYYPLKDGIKKEYGENFANYILSNRIIEELINGNKKPLPYQQEIFKVVARAFEIKFLDG